MSGPRDGASASAETPPVDPVTPGQWGTFRSHADQRRLAQVQAAKREREAARVTHDDSLRLDVGPREDTAHHGQRDETLTLKPRLDESSPTIPQHDGLALAAEPSSDARPQPGGTFGILVVCTGNVCRSPYIERVLAAELAGLPVRVEGAGTAALLIDRMSSGSQALLRERGLDAERYRPRQVTPALVRSADLVLAASREHRHILVEEAPTAASCIFALLDFADVCRRAGDPDETGVDGLRAFVRRSPAGSVERHSARSDADAEILDPFRQGPDVFARMAVQADSAIATVAGTIRRIMG